MKKPVIYILFFFLLVNSMNLWRSHYEQTGIAFSQNGLQFTKLNKTEVILNANKNEVFIIHLPEQALSRIYKVNSYHSGANGVTILVNEIPYAEQEEQQLVIKAINGQMQFRDTLQHIRYEDRRALIEPAERFQAWRLLQHEDQADFFALLDQFPLVILPLILFFFFLIWLYDSLRSLLHPFFGKSSPHYVATALFLLATLVLIKMATPEALAASKVSALLRILLIFSINYGLFQYFKTQNFYGQEFVKFVFFFLILLNVTIACSLLVNGLDQALFGASPHTMLNNYSQTLLPLEALHAFSFALANLLNNLRKHIARLRSSEQQLEHTQQQALASEAELKTLQASINPHFLYNSLNSIASLAPVAPEKTEQMALALSAFYEYATNREEQHICTLAEELEMLHNYLAIEKIRFGERLQYSFHCSEAAKACQLPRFLLQPIIENAIKYGYNSPTDRINVRLEAEQKNGQLELRVLDKGEPFSEHMAMGYGLHSVQKKLKLLFPNKHRLEFINEPKKQVYLCLIP